MSLPQMHKLSFEQEPWPDIPHLLLVPEEDSDRACLESLLTATQDLAALFSDHPEIDEDEPWFGWAFQREGEARSEHQLFQSAALDPQLRPLIETYVQRVIAYFQETDAEPGFYVHEEKEAASDAIYFLVKADPESYFERYLDYLGSIDLEHTVAQHDNARMLLETINAEQKDKLKSFLAKKSGGESFGF